MMLKVEGPGVCPSGKDAAGGWGGHPQRNLVSSYFHPGGLVWQGLALEEQV